MTPETRDNAYRAGRLNKAREFADAASLFYDEATGSAELADAYVTLTVHSGIAASDVICAAKLGEYSATADHSAALALLKRADPDAAKHLARVLSLKTKAGYTHRSVSTSDARIAERAHKALLHIAETL